MMGELRQIFANIAFSQTVVWPVLAVEMAAGNSRLNRSTTTDFPTFVVANVFHGITV